MDTLVIETGKDWPARQVPRPEGPINLPKDTIGTVYDEIRSESWSELELGEE